MCVDWECKPIITFCNAALSSSSLKSEDTPHTPHLLPESVLDAGREAVYRTACCFSASWVVYSKQE